MITYNDADCRYVEVVRAESGTGHKDAIVSEVPVLSDIGCALHQSPFRKKDVGLCNHSSISDGERP